MSFSFLFAGGVESRASAVTGAAGDTYRFGKTPSSAGSHIHPLLCELYSIVVLQSGGH